MNLRAFFKLEALGILFDALANRIQQCDSCLWMCLNRKAMAVHLWTEHGDEEPDEKTAALWVRLGLTR